MLWRIPKQVRNVSIELPPKLRRHRDAIEPGRLLRILRHRVDVGLRRARVESFGIRRDVRLADPSGLPLLDAEPEHRRIHLVDEAFGVVRSGGCRTSARGGNHEERERDEEHVETHGEILDQIQPESLKAGKPESLRAYELSLAQQVLQSVCQPSGIEIDKEALPQIEQLQVCQHLSLVDREHAVDALELN